MKYDTFFFDKDYFCVASKTDMPQSLLILIKSISSAAQPQISDNR